MALGAGFVAGGSGSVGALISPEFILSLDRSFSRGSIGSVGSREGVAFVLQLAPVSDAGLMATATSSEFLLFLGTSRRLPEPVNDFETLAS